MTLLGFGDDNLVFFDLEFSYVSIIGASISVFLGIVMTQSGFDKIFNWEGELDFITGKFASTPLANFSTFGLIQVTIFEILFNLFFKFSALIELSAISSSFKGSLLFSIFFTPLIVIP